FSSGGRFMGRIPLIAFLILAMCTTGLSAQKGSRSSTHSSTARVHTAKPSTPKPHVTKSAASRPSTPRKSTVATRDSRGQIKRSAAARNAFMRQTGHPHGWPGHVVDHKVPLECGGGDVASDMQWQTS